MRRLFGGRRKDEDDSDGDGEEVAQPGSTADSEEQRAADERDDEQRRVREAEAEAIQLAREQAAQADSARAALEAEQAARAQRAARYAGLPMWTDTHCHLQYAAGEAEADAMVERAYETGTRRMICVGTDVLSSRRAIELASRYRGSDPYTGEVFATVGLHPHDASAGVDGLTELFDEVKAGAGPASRVVGVGECGLDYHYDNSPREAQRKVFAAQVSMANELGLTLVIHTREAWDDTFKILEAEGVPARTVFHCFTGGPSEAQSCIGIGAYLSFSGIATFNNAGEIRDAARICPPDRLLVETDSPYLTPVPHRGKPNEPSYVPLVGAAIGEVRGLTSEDMAVLTSANAAAAFGIGGAGPSDPGSSSGSGPGWG